jgi:hypothetical protein
VRNAQPSPPDRDGHPLRVVRTGSVASTHDAVAYGRARGHDLGRNPTNSLLALFPGSLIVVPALVSYWRGTNRVQASARVGGREPVNGWIALILFLLISPAYWAYLQVSINQVWLAEAAGLVGWTLTL